MNQNRGPLAGLGAGAAAVIVAMVFVFAVWHRVSGAVGDAVIVFAIALMTAMAGVVIAAAVYAALWLRHRFRYPETLAGRQTVRAEVLAEAPDPQAVLAPAGQLAAIEPPREIHLHFSGMDGEEQAARVIRQAFNAVPASEELQS